MSRVAVAGRLTLRVVVGFREKDVRRVASRHLERDKSRVADTHTQSEGKETHVDAGSREAGVGGRRRDIRRQEAVELFVVLVPANRVQRLSLQVKVARQQERGPSLHGFGDREARHSQSTRSRRQQQQQPRDPRDAPLAHPSHTDCVSARSERRGATGAASLSLPSLLS